MNFSCVLLRKQLNSFSRPQSTINIYQHNIWWYISLRNLFIQSHSSNFQHYAYLSLIYMRKFKKCPKTYLCGQSFWHPNECLRADQLDRISIANNEHNSKQNKHLGRSLTTIWFTFFVPLFSFISHIRLPWYSRDSIYFL